MYIQSPIQSMYFDVLLSVHGESELSIVSSEAMIEPTEDPTIDPLVDVPVGDADSDEKGNGNATVGLSTDESVDNESDFTSVNSTIDTSSNSNVTEVYIA